MSDSIADILHAAVDSGTLVKAVLSGRRKDAEQTCRRVTVRPVLLRNQTAYQFALQHDDRETHENLSPAETPARIVDWFASSFQNAHVFTREADYEARRTADGAVRIKRRPPSHSDAPEKTHNAGKAYLVPDGEPCPFLIEIGVTTAAGNVRGPKQKKFRQINRFLELVNDVAPSLPAAGTLHVVDFGCGKSSLTFALHHLLTAIHGRDVQIVGLDRNARVIESCRQTAEKLGCRGLTFQQGDVATFPGFGGETQIDLVVALHACDTATDDALRQAVRWNAGVILAVPCCQHEVAAAMRPDRLQAVARHGILKERFAAVATDALRAEYLELHGYRTQVVEFIDLEHTAKNVLIRAVKRTGDAGAPLDQRRAEYEQLKQLLGISRLHLEADDGPP